MHCNYHIWYKMGNMHIVSCDKKSLKLAINYLLDQCLFKIGNLLLVQAIGISGVSLCKFHGQHISFDI